MKKKRCLIFGSNGFIAKSFSSSEEIKKEFKIIKFPKKKINLLKESSVKILKNKIKDNDYVLFVAGEVPNKSLIQLKNNLQMLTNFLLAIQHKKISYFSYISSDAVYEDTKNKINEKFDVTKTSIHGIMHLMRENLINKFYKGRLSIFRPTLIFGAEDPHNGYGPNKFIRLVLSRNKIILFGKGEEKRDHIHISAVVNILSNAFIKKKVGTYNIASGKIYSFYDIAKKIEKIHKKKVIKLKKRSEPPHHLGLRQFNISKLKRNFKNVELLGIMDYLNIYNLNEYKK